MTHYMCNFQEDFGNIRDIRIPPSRYVTINCLHHNFRHQYMYILLSHTYYKEYDFFELNYIKIKIKLKNRLWKPDVLLYNSASQEFDTTYEVNVNVHNDGLCKYGPPAIFESTCKVSFILYIKMIKIGQIDLLASFFLTIQAIIFFFEFFISD